MIDASKPALAGLSAVWDKQGASESPQDDVQPSSSHTPADDPQPGVDPTPAENAPPSAHPTPLRSTPMTWARLLARVFLADAFLCPHCGARMQWVAALTDPDSIRTYLAGVGLLPEAPTTAPPRPPPQRELAFDD